MKGENAIWKPMIFASAYHHDPLHGESLTQGQKRRHLHLRQPRSSRTISFSHGESNRRAAQASGYTSCGEEPLFFRSQVDLKTIQKLFRNQTPTNITTETLDKLAMALNVDVSLLIESEPPLPKTLE